MEALIFFIVIAGYIGLKVAFGATQDPIAKDKKKFDAGIRLVKAKDWNKAYVYFNAMISDSPRSAVAYAFRGKCRLAMGEVYNALADFTKATDLDYNMAEAYIDKTKALIELEEYEQALAEAHKAVWHLRNNGEAHRLRGVVLLKMGEAGKAALDFKKAVSLGDEDAGFILSQHRLYQR